MNWRWNIFLMHSLHCNLNFTWKQKTSHSASDQNTCAQYMAKAKPRPLDSNKQINVESAAETKCLHSSGIAYLKKIYTSMKSTHPLFCIWPFLYWGRSTSGASTLLELLSFFFFSSKINHIFEGLNMLENSWNFTHMPKVVKMYIWYGFQKWVWQNGSIHLHLHLHLCI